MSNKIFNAVSDTINTAETSLTLKVVSLLFSTPVFSREGFN